MAFVEPDRIVTASDIVEQKNTTWNLARICINKAPNPWDYMNYRYDSSGGEGITAYVIDTGINIEHEEFGGRAVFGFNAMGNGEADEDEYGHGTHIAGIIGGTLYGVAKKTNLISVKVLDSNGQGTISTVVAGIQWTVEHAAKNKITRKSVANLSLGSSYSASLNMMVESAIASGITFVVAVSRILQTIPRYTDVHRLETLTTTRVNTRPHRFPALSLLEL